MPEPGGAPPEKSEHPPQDQANQLGINTDVGATDNGGRERCVIQPRNGTNHDCALGHAVTCAGMTPSSA